MAGAGPHLMSSGETLVCPAIVSAGLAKTTPATAIAAISVGSAAFMVTLRCGPSRSPPPQSAWEQFGSLIDLPIRDLKRGRKPARSPTRRAPDAVPAAKGAVVVMGSGHTSVDSILCSHRDDGRSRAISTA